MDQNKNQNETENKDQDKVQKKELKKATGYMAWGLVFYTIIGGILSIVGVVFYIVVKNIAIVFSTPNWIDLTEKEDRKSVV